MLCLQPFPSPLDPKTNTTHHFKSANPNPLFHFSISHLSVSQFTKILGFLVVWFRFQSKIIMAQGIYFNPCIYYLFPNLGRLNLTLSRCLFFYPWFVEGDNGSPKSSSLTPYEEALDALSSLITQRTRVGDVNMEERFNVLFEYLKVHCFWIGLQ